MSYCDGWAALNLEMPDRVPRTEYSAEIHWNLISTVTGISVNSESDRDLQGKASDAFIKVWNYDFIWSILTNSYVFGDKRTKMGHAVYAEGGTDFNNNISALFTDPEEALSFDPWEMYGKKERGPIVRDFNEHYKANCNKNPDAVNMTGIYISCMSGLIEIFGWEILLAAAGIDHDGFGKVTNCSAPTSKNILSILRV